MKATHDDYIKYRFERAWKTFEEQQIMKLIPRVEEFLKTIETLTEKKA